jgi:hypothetical protein
VDDGLRQRWDGLVFVNPPFGGRCGHLPWLHKFFDHGNGVAICRAYTSSWWFHEVVLPRAEVLCFPKGKTKFIRPDGSIGTAPGHGIALIGMGEVANTALKYSGLGWFVALRPRACLALLDDQQKLAQFDEQGQFNDGGEPWAEAP